MAEETQNEETQNEESQSAEPGDAPVEETPVGAEASETTEAAAEDAPAEEAQAAPEDAPAAEPAAEEPEPVAEVEPAAEEEPAAEPEPEAAAEPAAEAEPEAAASSAEPEEGEAPSAPQSGPKPKRKRLPRRLRPQKTRPRHAASGGERKPIVRQPKPDHERGRRQERRGVVVSSAMDKTIVVKVDVITSHQRYKKVIRRSVKFHAHDEQNAAKVGDVVRIVETRPLSATKRWRLAEVVEAAK
jgi:small subunit ribosomal protein S17